MKKDAKSTIVVQFLDAQLWVKGIRPKPTIPLAHNTVLSKEGVARCKMTRVELMSFKFSSGSESLSIDNAVLCHITKRLLYTTVKNKDFLYFIDTKPYISCHYDLQNFALYINGNQIPSGGN